MFQFSLPGGAAGEDVLGIWQASPVLAAASADGMAFATSAEVETPVDAVVWKVDLPSDPRQAASALRQQQAALQMAGLDLLAAQNRLQAFAATQQPGADQPAQAFGLEEAGFFGPEAELSEWLPSSRSGMSFGLGISLPHNWQETAEEALDFFGKVRQMLANYAFVESSSGGSAIGRTEVSWLGDFETLWRSGLAEDQVKMHRNSVELALASRQAWIKMAMLVTQGAALFGLLSSTGNPLLIPAVYKFIRQVLEQSREIRRTQAASG